MPPMLRFSRSQEDWVVLGEARRGGPDGELVLKREELSRLSATELRRALRSNANFYETDEATATISIVPEEYFDQDAPVGPVDFRLQDDSLLVSIDYYDEWPKDGDETNAISEIRDLIAPFLTERRCQLQSIAVNDWMSSVIHLGFLIQLKVPLRGRNLQELLTLGEEVLELCEAFGNGHVLRETVGALVRGGGAHLLIGQPEGNWLDAKSQEYNLDTAHGEISLAQAVARFCNAEDGGLIVIGADAKKIPGGEVIRGIRGVNASPGVAAKYLKVIDRRLYPPPLGLRVDEVEGPEGRMIIAIDIPAQGEELKPFLVHGAIMPDGKVEGAFISIVQRRGESSIPITAPMIHSTLAAGRALLRGTPKDV